MEIKIRQMWTAVGCCFCFIRERHFSPKQHVETKEKRQTMRETNDIVSKCARLEIILELDKKKNKAFLHVCPLNNLKLFNFYLYCFKNI